MVSPDQLSDLEKARLFLRALNSYTLGEAALRQRAKLKPPFRLLVDRLLAKWEMTETLARRSSTLEAKSLLHEFIKSLDERMEAGQRDIEERFASRQRTGPLFLAWGLFYLFKVTALDLTEELAASAAEHAQSGAEIKEPSPTRQGSPDVAALQEFQMALYRGS